jgi:leukotriene-A4 hydrolase
MSSPASKEAEVRGPLTSAASSQRPPAGALDPHSRSEPHRVRVVHMDLDLALDFDAERVSGSVTHRLERPDPSAPLLLDTADLEVLEVVGEDGDPRSWSLGEPRGREGRALRVDLHADDTEVTVRYATRPEGEAVQWLAPPQTADGTHPFVYTQGQAILTRSWIPCQDTPGNRVTWSAWVQAPRDLRVVMSGEGTGPRPLADAPQLLRWRHELPLAVPPYLIALAAGRLERRAISPRVAVFAEPGLVDAAAAELEDTEAMLSAAERLFGPYRWGRYDVLFLPPAFPYGGMENPLLTFATPTILAGDRSLVALVAHELAHSWSGNLVTNATWEDFWLNEGFTVYCEKRIVEEVFGRERAVMEMALDRTGLETELEELEPWQTVLDIDLEGHHPDDGFSGVPYEKGALLLRRIEELVGREVLDGFLASWFERHAFQSATTAEFEAFLAKELFPVRPGALQLLDLEEWLREPGLPADAPTVTSEELLTVDREVTRWVAGAAAADLETAGWNTFQWLRFLGGIAVDTEPARLGDLDAAFGFTGSGNAEVQCAWLALAARKGYAPARPALEEFLGRVGRRKFLVPLYRALLDADPEGARALYGQLRERYHAVSRETLDGLVLEGA